MAILATMLIAIGGSNVESKENDRWYLQSQVDAGRVLFDANCAPCHGKNAQGAKNWREPLINDGEHPPPLNGTGHVWHHGISHIKLSITAGGGIMPAFEEMLSDADIDAVIAYFQSKWPSEIYQTWIEHGSLEK